MSIFHPPGNPTLKTVLSVCLKKPLNALCDTNEEIEDRLFECLEDFEFGAYDLPCAERDDASPERIESLVSYARCVAIPEILWQGYTKYIDEWIDSYSFPSDACSGPVAYSYWRRNNYGD